MVGKFQPVMLVSGGCHQSLTLLLCLVLGGASISSGSPVLKGTYLTQSLLRCLVRILICMAFGCHGNTFALKLLVIFSQSQSGWTRRHGSELHSSTDTDVSMLDQGSFYQQKMPKKKWWKSLLTVFVEHHEVPTFNTQKQIFTILHNNHPPSTTIPTGINPSWSTDWTSPFRISSSIIPRKLGQSSSNKQFQKPGSCACPKGRFRSQGSLRFGGAFFTKKRMKHTKVTMESQHALLANRM